MNSKWIATMFDISIESFIPNHLNQFHIHLDTSCSTYIWLKSNHRNDRAVLIKKNLFYFEVQKGKDFFNNWNYMGRCSRGWTDTLSMITLVKVMAEHYFSNRWSIWDLRILSHSGEDDGGPAKADPCYEACFIQSNRWSFSHLCFCF